LSSVVLDLLGTTRPVTGTRTVELTRATAPQGMPSIGDDPNARQGKPGSDHANVRLLADRPRSAREAVPRHCWRREF
jgi:hypothetical protein